MRILIVLLLIGFGGYVELTVDRMRLSSGKSSC